VETGWLGPGGHRALRPEPKADCAAGIGTCILAAGQTTTLDAGRIKYYARLPTALGAGRIEGRSGPLTLGFALFLITLTVALGVYPVVADSPAAWRSCNRACRVRAATSPYADTQAPTRSACWRAASTTPRPARGAGPRRRNRFSPTRHTSSVHRCATADGGDSWDGWQASRHRGNQSKHPRAG